MECELSDRARIWCVVSNVVSAGAWALVQLYRSSLSSTTTPSYSHYMRIYFLDYLHPEIQFSGLRSISLESWTGLNDFKFVICNVGALRSVCRRSSTLQQRQRRRSLSIANNFAPWYINITLNLKCLFAHYTYRSGRHFKNRIEWHDCQLSCPHPKCGGYTLLLSFSLSHSLNLSLWSALTVSLTSRDIRYYLLWLYARMFHSIHVYILAHVIADVSSVMVISANCCTNTKKKILPSTKKEKWTLQSTQTPSKTRWNQAKAKER